MIKKKTCVSVLDLGKENRQQRQNFHCIHTNSHTGYRGFD